MRIQYASDLHLEFYDNSVFMARGPLKVAGDVLVLAGDTLPLREFDTYKQHRFFDWCAANYRVTLLVPGNHEYYRDDVAAYPESWEKALRPNVRMCENKVVRVDDTDFILSTLWSHIPYKAWPKLKKGMSDFTLIRDGNYILAAGAFNALHERDFSFIRKAVSESEAAHKVVVTHHVPSSLLVSPEFKGSALESGFTVDLTDYIRNSGVDLWVYGHSHRSIEKLIGHTRVVSNQIGYVAYGEYGKNFSGDRFVDLEDDELIPYDKGEIVNLTNRANGGLFLEQVATDSPWYRLMGSTSYTRIIGKDPIMAFDPAGGPFVSRGSKVGGRIVEEIRCEGNDLLVKLQ